MAEIVLAQIDHDELALRISEAMFSAKRPPFMTAKAIMDKMPEHERESIYRGATAAIYYIAETMGEKASVQITSKGAA